MLMLSGRFYGWARVRSTLGLIALAGLFVNAGNGIPAFGQTGDSIKPLQGRDIRCTIKETMPEGIRYEVNGQSHSIMVVEIKSVDFAGEPNEIGRARTRLEAGQFDDCLAELQKVDPTALKDFLKAEHAYLKANAEAKKSLREGTMALLDAARSVNQFLETYPKSYHFFEMSELFGWLAFHSSQFPAADKSFQSLAQSNIPSIVAAGYLGLARTALEQSKWDEAQQHLTAISALTVNDDQTQEIKLIARCLAARILAEQNKAAEAIALLEEIIKTESDEKTRVFANLYNALGLAQLRAGNAKEALLAFLHTDQLYSNEADPHAEALFYLASLWNQVNETDRSNRARQTLTQQYRNSLWASKQ